jgi:general secretion pathway protein G
MAASNRTIGWALMVISMLLLASGLAIWRPITSFGRARHLAVQADLSAIKFSLDRYKSITGHYPTTEQGLAALVARQLEPASLYGGRTVLNSLPKDLWGNDYVYRCPGKKNLDAYDLFSAGPDGVVDTTDDDWGER